MCERSRIPGGRIRHDLFRRLPGDTIRRIHLWKSIAAIYAYCHWKADTAPLFESIYILLYFTQRIN